MPPPSHHAPTPTQRLHRDLPLSAEELEDVFDSLDSGRNGYLTLEAFSSGFSRCPHPGRRNLHTAAVLQHFVCVCVCHNFITVPK